MDTTIEQRAMAAYKHVTSIVLDQPDGSPLLKALATSGINNIYGLLSLDGKNIAALNYDHNGTKKFLNCCDQNRVHAFVAYVCHRTRAGTPIRTNYLSVTMDDFNAYRRTAYLVDTNHSNTLTENDRVADFLADTRRSSSLFRRPIVFDNKEDTHGTGAMTNNPEPLIAQADIIGEENIPDNGKDTCDTKTATRDMAAYKHVTSTVIHQPDGSPLLQESTGHGNSPETVRHEPNHMDLQKSILALKEHNKDLGRSYNKIKHSKEYKPTVFLVATLWQPEPPPPEPPPHHC